MSKKANRDELRSRFFSEENKRRKSALVNLLGSEVELRQPTIGQVAAISKKAEGEQNSALVSIIIEYCYVPGTDEKVFEDGDKEALMSMPSGEWLIEFNKALSKLTGVDVKEAEGNSQGTAKG